MKVSVEKLPTSEAVLTVDLTWDELEKASDKAYKKLVKQVDIQGFRRGKAPRSLLERRVGKETIYQEGLDDLITDTYRDILKEHDLTPITQPELDAPIFEMGQDYHFTLKVPILTPVKLGDYKSLHFDREDVTVTSEEVEQELESLRNRQAEWKEVDRPAQIHDRVTVDLKLTSGDETISDLKDNPFELTDERHGLFKGMDEEVVGMKAGEQKSFTTTIPDDYTNEKLAGKESNYDITLHKVETKELPELDDEFAKTAGSNDLEDLRTSVSDSILEEKKRSNRDGLREQVINGVIEQSEFTLHPVLIQEEAEEMIHQLGHLLEQQRMSMDQYLMMMRKTREEYLEELKPDAEKRVKNQLVLDEVAKAEEISVAPEEIEALYRAYAQAGNELPRTESQIRALAMSYLREKTITRLVELTTDPDPDAESEEEVLSIENAEAAALAAEAEESGSEEEQETPTDEAATVAKSTTDVVE